MVSGERRTKEILGKTMSGIESYLEFTVESGEDFKEGWLPTLDVELKVAKNNTIDYRFFEKSTTTNQTVHKKSAMEENAKIQILANDVVRRLSNTKEHNGDYQEASRVIDGYGQKLLNSGFLIDQVRNILIKGIKGFEGRKMRCKKEGRSLHCTAKESSGSRSRKKLLSRSSWYKKKRKQNPYDKNQGGGNRRADQESNKEGAKNHVEQKSLMFVEQTEMGELARRLRDLMTRISPTLGFSIKIVERTGTNWNSIIICTEPILFCIFHITCVMAP